MSAKPKTRSRVVHRVAPAELVLGICHEVGNLLAATRLGAHLMAKGLVGPDPAAAAIDIEREAARAGAFLGQVRPLLGLTPARRQRVAVVEVLGALERSVGAAAGGPPQLAIRTPREVADLRVDPDALHHVLVALVLAAADATAPEGHVLVSARREGPRVVFTIEDDGNVLEAGPPRGVAPRRGRSLVLSAAAAVVRGQGGSLQVTPRRRGTRVRVSLPAARPYAASRSARRDSASRTEAGGSRRSQTSPTAASPRSR